MRLRTPGSTLELLSRRGDAGQADDPLPDVLRACLEQHLHEAGALDDDVGFGGRLAQLAAVEVGGPEPADHLRLAAFGDQVEYVGVVAALSRQQGGEQPDGPGAGDEYPGGGPGGPAADLLDVVPGLGHDGGRFEQHAEGAEGGIHRDQVVGADAVPLGGIAVPGLDAPLGVLAVGAHVPVTGRAGRAGNGVGLADDADDQVSLGRIRYPVRPRPPGPAIRAR